jgi:hypothetical protein
MNYRPNATYPSSPLAPLTEYGKSGKTPYDRKGRLRYVPEPQPNAYQGAVPSMAYQRVVRLPEYPGNYSSGLPAMYPPINAARKKELQDAIELLQAMKRDVEQEAIEAGKDTAKAQASSNTPPLFNELGPEAAVHPSMLFMQPEEIEALYEQRQKRAAEITQKLRWVANRILELQDQLAAM